MAGRLRMVASRKVTLDDGSQRQLARLGTRLGARVIDTILVSVGAWLLGRIGGGIIILDILPDVGVFGLIIVILVIILGYEVTMIALKGQTVGKMMVGIKVVRAADGHIPGWGKSFGRFLVPQLPALIPARASTAASAIWPSASQAVWCSTGRPRSGGGSINPMSSRRARARRAMSSNRVSVSPYIAPVIGAVVTLTIVVGRPHVDHQFADPDRYPLHVLQVVENVSAREGLCGRSGGRLRYRVLAVKYSVDRGGGSGRSGGGDLRR